MKFRMIPLGYLQTPDYPYDYRIELIEYHPHEREQLSDWLKDNVIPYTTTGWKPGSVLYLREREAMLFALRWS